MPGFGSLAPGTSSEDDLLNQYYDPGTGLPAPGPDRYRPRRPWVVEPDLLETQTGLRKYPPGITTNEAGEPVSAETGEPATVVRRPSVLPITSTPEGPRFVKPKVADLLPYILGGPAGEGFGPVSRLVSAKKPGLGLPLEAAQLAGVGRQLPPVATTTVETPPSEPPTPAQRPLPDVGPPAISPGPQISAGVPWANRAADIGSRIAGPMAADIGTLGPLRRFVKSTVEASKYPAGSEEAHQAYGDVGKATADLGLMMMAPERPEPGVLSARIARAPKSRIIIPQRIFAPTAGESRIINAGVENPVNPAIQTVRDPYRMMFPGIYGNPRTIAAEAAARVGPEDPAMKRLFGVTRADLWEMNQGRVGNQPPAVPPAGARSRGAESVQRIMTPENAQRLQDILGEAGKYPGLRYPDAWYNMDPAFARMAQLHGPVQAIPRYSHFNAMTGMASPGSDVETEIARGTGAHWLEQQGRFPDFVRYAGVPAEERGAGFPEDLRYLPGHVYHSTSQAGPMERYLAAGRTMVSKNPKVPLYVGASGVPETGFQTRGPVGDAHWSRGVGLADTRKGPSDVQASFSTPEYQTAQPWWEKDIARAAGLESVPAQARLWTVLGPQTGVESALGAPKLEILSTKIMKAADRLGISPEAARDLVLSGKAGAGLLAGGVLGGSAFGSLIPREERQ